MYVWFQVRLSFPYWSQILHSSLKRVFYLEHDVLILFIAVTIIHSQNKESIKLE